MCQPSPTTWWLRCVGRPCLYGWMCRNMKICWYQVNMCHAMGLNPFLVTKLILSCYSRSPFSFSVAIFLFVVCALRTLENIWCPSYLNPTNCTHKHITVMLSSKLHKKAYVTTAFDVNSCEFVEFVEFVL